jgi:hypothetical protein
MVRTAATAAGAASRPSRRPPSSRGLTSRSEARVLRRSRSPRFRRASRRSSRERGCMDEELDLVVASADLRHVESGASRRRRRRRAPAGVTVASITSRSEPLVPPSAARVSSRCACAISSMRSAAPRGRAARCGARGASAPGRAAPREAQRAGGGAHGLDRVLGERLGREGLVHGLVEDLVEPRRRRGRRPRAAWRAARRTVRPPRAALARPGAKSTSRGSARESSASKRGGAVEARRGELGRRQIEQRDPERPRPRPALDGDEVVVLARGELLGVGDEPRRDDAHHLPRDDALDLRGVAHLLAERDLAPEREQLGDVAVRGVVRDAGHGDAVGPALVAARERQAEGSARRRRRPRGTSRRSPPSGRRGRRRDGSPSRPRTASSPG